MPKTKQKPKVEVCFTPNLFPLHYDDADIIVAIDVLRATSAICAAFHHGVKKMIPVATLEEAFEYKRKGYLVGAERKGEIVEGFEFGNSPFAYMREDFKGKTIVLSTTNGTVAIDTAAKTGKIVVVGSLLNLDALCDWLIKKQKNVLVLGSGWKNKFCLEDTICAGAICDQLLQTNKFISEEDSSVAAKFLYLSAKDNYLGYLKASSHRKRLKKLNLNEDIKYCLTPNQTNVIPILKDGALVKLKV
jgi:2-phosphosulfolactate phosphatase